MGRAFQRPQTRIHMERAAAGRPACPSVLRGCRSAAPGCASESGRGHRCQAAPGSSHTGEPSSAPQVASLTSQGVCRKRKNLMPLPPPAPTLLLSVSSIPCVSVPEFPNQKHAAQPWGGRCRTGDRGAGTCSFSFISLHWVPVTRVSSIRGPEFLGTGGQRVALPACRQCLICGGLGNPRSSLSAAAQLPPSSSLRSPSCFAPVSPSPTRTRVLKGYSLGVHQALTPKKGPVLLPMTKQGRPRGAQVAREGRRVGCCRLSAGGRGGQKQVDTWFQIKGRVRKFPSCR